MRLLGALILGFSMASGAQLSYGQSRAFTVAMAVAPGAVILDVGSTIKAERRGPHLAEMNPLLGNTPMQHVFASAAWGGTTAIAARRLASSGHPKVATAMMFAISAVHVGAGIHNLRAH